MTVDVSFLEKENTSNYKNTFTYIIIVLHFTVGHDDAEVFVSMHDSIIRILLLWMLVAHSNAGRDQLV